MEGPRSRGRWRVTHVPRRAACASRPRAPRRRRRRTVVAEARGSGAGRCRVQCHAAPWACFRAAGAAARAERRELPRAPRLRRIDGDRTPPCTQPRAAPACSYIWRRARGAGAERQRCGPARQGRARAPAPPSQPSRATGADMRGCGRRGTLEAARAPLVVLVAFILLGLYLEAAHRAAFYRGGYVRYHEEKYNLPLNPSKLRCWARHGHVPDAEAVAAADASAGVRACCSCQGYEGREELGESASIALLTVQVESGTRGWPRGGGEAQRLVQENHALYARLHNYTYYNERSLAPLARMPHGAPPPTSLGGWARTCAELPFPCALRVPLLTLPWLRLASSPTGRRRGAGGGGAEELGAGGGAGAAGGVFEAALRAAAAGAARRAAAPRRRRAHRRPAAQRAAAAARPERRPQRHGRRRGPHWP
eukprot:scaffold2145_cov309-Prasinococcus_capsulatus_cf.AAC.4